MPAGWYPAPHANNEPRYWDGRDWSETPPPFQPEQPAAPMYGSVAQMAPPAVRAPGSANQPYGLSVAALVVGIVAFLTGLVPVLGLVLAITAVVLAIMALVKRHAKKMAITGLVLGGVALLTGVAVAGGGDDSTDSASKASSVVESAETAKPSEPAEQESQTNAPAAADEPEKASEAAPTADGTVENPSPQPYTAKGLLGGEKYSLTARIVDANANAAVAQYNMFNDEAPAGFKYVIAELTMTGIDPDGVEPSLASIDLSLATPEGNRYDGEYIMFGDGMPSMSDGPTLYPGSKFTGYTAYLVPDSAQSFLLYDNGKYIAF